MKKLLLTLTAMISAGFIYAGNSSETMFITGESFESNQLNGTFTTNLTYRFQDTTTLQRLEIDLPPGWSLASPNPLLVTKKTTFYLLLSAC